MRMKYFVAAILLLGLSGLLIGQSVYADNLADDLTAGKVKAESSCQTCHGMDGVATIPTAPNISGQQKHYMIIQLEAYRSGKRQHAQMSIIAQSLSDEDIERVAQWYASINVTVELPEGHN